MDHAKVSSDADASAALKAHTASSNAQETQASSSEASDSVPVDKKQPSKLKQLWAKTGLDVPTILIMVKAGIPPTIATAMYQATPVAKEYGTLGYLVSVMSILGFCIMPRAKFIQTMLLNVVAVCIGAAVALLSIYCSVQARKHTTPSGAPLTGYNSSASAVSAIWLFFQVYIVNTIKSARPQFTFPAIVYAIFALVASTNGPQFPTMAVGEAFAKRLLIAFLTGFGLASGVSFVIWPTSTRLVVFKEITGYLQSMRAVLKAQNAYLHGMEDEDMFLGLKKRAKNNNTVAGNGDSKGEEEKTKKKRPSPTAVGQQIAAYKGSIAAMIQIHGKLAADLPFAKREVAYGKLAASDIKRISKLLRNILLPLIGLSSIMDIFDRIAQSQGWDKLAESSEESEIERVREQKAVKEWQSILKTLHEPFRDISQTMDDGIEHILLRLELTKPPKAKKGAQDVEENGSDPRPGNEKFTEYLHQKSLLFYQGRETTLRSWCEQNNINLEPGTFDTNFEWLEHGEDVDNTQHERDQRQLFCVLYMEYLLWSASRALFELAKFADEKHQDGTMKGKRLIAPGLKSLKKWVVNITKRDDAPSGDHKVLSEATAVEEISMGDAFQHRHDPEHLPPTNSIEKLGNYVRMFPRFMRSPHSAFGFRAACATMSIGIIAFLADSYTFFLQQRLVWAMIMIAFSMTRTSGESAFNFLLRIFGTFVAMVACYVIYYIVDGKTPGVIVFLFIWVAGCHYVVLKAPRFVVVGIISAVTAVLIVGYELEVRKIGTAAAASTGQPYYPVYQLAPYRLATVAGGLFVAYIWTIFPYPVTEHRHLRHDLGAALYLLANHYSIVHETVCSRVRGDAGGKADENSPRRKLEKAHDAVITKALLLITKLKTSSEFTRWQISVGGRFPKETYDSIIDRCQRILSYAALMGYASTSFDSTINEESAGEKTEESQWLHDFRKLIKSTKTTSHEITSILALLSNSISNGQPLPPYLHLPQPYRLVKRLEAMDRDILGIKHIAEPGYAAFAVMQIAGRSIISDIEALTSEIKSLVGELDFSFHAVRTSDTSSLSPSSGSSLDHADSNGKGKKD